MNKRKPAKGALWAAAFTPFLLTACVDDSYDLTKDIDMTVTIGGNLSIPGSETEEFTLEDILDLEENSVIKADADGNYAFNKADTTETNVDIDPVRIEEPNPDGSDEDLTFTFSTSGIAGELEGTVDETHSMSFTYNKDDVTKDIVSLTSATVNFDVNIIFGFTGNENVKAITLKKGFTVELEMEGQTEPDGFGFELLDDDYAIADGAPQTIVFQDDQEIERGNSLRIPIRFTEIRNFPEGQGLYETGHFQLQVNVIPNGTATTTDLGTGDITVTFIHNAEVPEFTLQTITGIVDPDIDVNVDPIELDGVPDVLKDNVNLDLVNPYIKLMLENESPADINFKGHITWIKDNVQAEGFDIGTDLGTNVTGQTIIMEGNVTSEYYLSRIGMEDIAPERNIILGDNIYDMIRNIPDEIRLTNVDAKAIQEETSVELGENGAHYEVNTIYELNAPLRFGENANIVYKDTVDGWSSDLEDITIKKAVVEMTALNGIPLNFTVDAQAIDRNGNVYANVNVTPVSNVILPGLKLADGNEEAATESAIQLELTCENGDMSELDGLIIEFTADMENVDESLNVTLNKGMTLQLSNIRVRIENGVTVDMN